MLASERAYHTLRENILTGELAPGSFLGEVETAEHLGISRTPLREALRSLVAEGLATQLSRGVEVSEISLDDLAKMYEVRITLESRAASIAATHRNKQTFEDLLQKFQAIPGLMAQDAKRHHYYKVVSELDTAIDNSLDNQFFVSMLNTMRTHFQRIRHMAHSNTPRLLEAAKEHALIVKAIIDQNAELAASATSVHLYKSLENRLDTVARMDQATELSNATGPEQTKIFQNQTN